MRVALLFPLIGRRLLASIPTLLIVSIFTFGIMRLAPGDPVRMYLSSDLSNANPDDVARVREQLGLNDPLHEQYVRWLGQAVQGNFGYSIVSKRPVLEMIWEKVPASLSLMVPALILAITVGIGVGTLAALKQNSWIDYVATVMVFAGNALPSFFIGMMAIWIFAVQLGWLPTGQMRSVSTSDPVWLDYARHLILPVLVTSFVSLVAWVRYQRSSMLEVLHADFIRVARAKGLPERQVLFRHAWRNSLVPIVTLIGLSITNLVGGSYVIETVFAWPGLGQFGFDAVLARDYPVIMGITMISSVVIVAGNLIADIAYTLLNPQMREHGAANR